MWLAECWRLMSKLLDRLRTVALELKRQVGLLALAMCHPLVSWGAKLIIGLTLAYACSPIDLIPDFIPILGLLDDLIIVPAGIWLALRLIPEAVKTKLAAEAASQPVQKSYLGLALVMSLWVVASYAITCLVFR